MSDSSTPSATPNPGKKPRKKPSPLDAATMAQLGKDEENILAVQDRMRSDTAFTTVLGNYYMDGANTILITPASIADLVQQIATTRATAQQATSGTAQFHDITDQEEVSQESLHTAIQAVQARAKNKYEESNPALLKSYHIGQRFDSREDLEQAAAGIYSRIRTTDDEGHPVTPQDTLPNLKPEVVSALKSGYDAYTALQTQQSNAQSGASQSRLTLKEQCQQISRRRRKVQLAIDAEYPPGEANAALRKLFGLPADKAMS